MQLVFEILIWAFKAILLIVLAIVGTIGRAATSLLGATGTIEKTLAERGENFVRAYLFLELLNTNASINAAEANSIAKTLFQPSSNSDEDQKVIFRAMEYSRQFHGGKQLPVIRAAEVRGFIIN